METSACLNLRKIIYKHQITFVVYAGITGLLFYYDYPPHIREASGLITQLIIRPIKPYIRITEKENLLYYQLAGLAFQLYVLYCSGVIKLHMMLMATILKNASEMWNIRFALAFNQCISGATSLNTSTFTLHKNVCQSVISSHLNTFYSGDQESWSDAPTQA